MSFLRSIMRFTFSETTRRNYPIPAAPQPMRQVAILTSTQPHPISHSDTSLPVAVMDLVVNRHCSAVRAWRTHRGMAVASLQERTNMRGPTLLALDRGDVELCEWTVELLARALRVEPSLLLKAELLADKTREEAVWPPIVPKRRNMS